MVGSEEFFKRLIACGLYGQSLQSLQFESFFLTAFFCLQRTKTESRVRSRLEIIKIELVSNQYTL